MGVSDPKYDKYMLQNFFKHKTAKISIGQLCALVLLVVIVSLGLLSYTVDGLSWVDQ